MIGAVVAVVVLGWLIAAGGGCTIACGDRCGVIAHTDKPDSSAGFPVFSDDSLLMEVKR
jgi:hypothetical protein